MNKVLSVFAAAFLALGTAAATVAIVQSTEARAMLFWLISIYCMVGTILTIFLDQEYGEEELHVQWGRAWSSEEWKGGFEGMSFEDLFIPVEEELTLTWEDVAWDEMYDFGEEFKASALLMISKSHSADHAWFQAEYHAKSELAYRDWMVCRLKGLAKAAARVTMIGECDTRNLKK